MQISPDFSSSQNRAVQKLVRRSTARAMALSCIEYLFQKANGGNDKAEEILACCAHDLQTLASTQITPQDQN